MAQLILDPRTVITTGSCWTLALNRNQNLLGKAMLVLNRECQDIRRLVAEEWSELTIEIQRVTAALDQLFEPDLYNYAFLMNLDRQVHLHIIPRYSMPRSWRGTTFHDPHFSEAAGTDVRTLQPADMTTLVEAIQDRLPASPRP